MKLGIFTLFWALLLSSTAAYFSIVGLAALFAATFWPVVVMGAVIEGGKVLATVILHKFWDNPSFSGNIKKYLLSAVVAGMVVTAIGVYGFLSKGHLEQESPLAAIELQIQQREQNIQYFDNANKALQAQLDQMDKSVQIFFDSGKASQGLAARNKQKIEREAIAQQIKSNNEESLKLQQEIIKIKTDSSEVTAKLGAVKYVAELFGWKEPGTAVRFVIFILMWCFDPLAIVLVISGVICIEEHNKREEAKKEAAELARIRKEEEEAERARKEAEKERKRATEEKRRAAVERRAELQEQRKLLELELNNKYKKEAEELRAQLEAVKEVSENSVQLLEENIHLKDEVTRKEQEIETLVAEIQKKAIEIKTLQEEEERLAELIAESEAFKEAQVELENQKNAYNELVVVNAKLHDEIVAAKEQLEANLVAQEELRAKIVELEDRDPVIVHVRDEAAIDEINQLTEDNKGLVEHIEKLSEQIEALRVTMAVREETINVLTKDLEDKEAALTEAKATISNEELEILQAELEEKNRELEKSKAEIEARNTELEIRNGELEVLCEALERKATKANQYDEDLREAFFSNDKERVLAIMEKKPEILDDIIGIVTSYQQEKLKKAESLERPGDYVRKGDTATQVVIEEEEKQDKMVVEVMDTVNVTATDEHTTNETELSKYDPNEGWVPAKPKKKDK